MTDKQFHRLVNLHRYCGFYASDLRGSNTYMQLYVVKGYNIVLDILYFNMQWSKSVCSQQGVILAADTASNSVFCGKRLPWQFKHVRSNLFITIYGLNRHALPAYFNFFYGIHMDKIWKRCCKRTLMPASLILRTYSKRNENDFYIVASLKYKISIQTDKSNTFLMFDGPGKKSPSAQLTSKLRRQSSSSQIVISTLKTYNLSGRVNMTYIPQFKFDVLKNNSCFTYIAKRSVTSAKIDIEYGNSKNNYVCHYVFHGSDYFYFRPHINITMFSYDGPTVHTETWGSACQYGGIYFHTKDKNGEFKLRMEMCGNIEENIRSIVSYKEKYTFLSIVWYSGYSSGKFMAELQLIACSTVLLPCSIFARKTFDLSEMSSCNIFYFTWLGDEMKRHNCKFKIFSFNSWIIGPAHISISTDSKSKMKQNTSANASVFMKSFNDWPHWTHINKKYLQLVYTDPQHLTRQFKYLDMLVVGYRGEVQPGRLLKLTVNTAGCQIREDGGLNFSIQNTVIVHYLCNEVQRIRADRSFDFIYAPFHDKEELQIYSTSVSCPKHISSILHVIEYNRETKLQYNYTVRNTMNLKFKGQFPGSDVRFFMRYPGGFQVISEECDIRICVFISKVNNKLTGNRGVIVQQSGRRLQFHESRLIDDNYFF